eukprot:364101-Chlamydomonas_euryale.AAC.7
MEEQTRGGALWERLMGRLAARLAWKRTCLMLHWLSSLLSFSYGLSTRQVWRGGGGAGVGCGGWCGERTVLGADEYRAMHEGASPCPPGMLPSTDPMQLARNVSA